MQLLNKNAIKLPYDDASIVFPLAFKFVAHRLQFACSAAAITFTTAYNLSHFAAFIYPSSYSCRHASPHYDAYPFADRHRNAYPALPNYY
ncbi:MAG: hypothetical protein DDG60_09425 [Anaerolineae bacterium]|nr:MAG: hypothetical protein DDG60_09425 [Anaerolineae bacterium]